MVLISSLNDDDTTNIATMSSAWWVGRTAVLGMSVNSQTVHNLAERPVCVLNLVNVIIGSGVERQSRPGVAPATGRESDQGQLVGPDLRRLRGSPGDAVRLIGEQGGPGAFTSIAELEVYDDG